MNKVYMFNTKVNKINGLTKLEGVLKRSWKLYPYLSYDVTFTFYIVSMKKIDLQLQMWVNKDENTLRGV